MMNYIDIQKTSLYVHTIKNKFSSDNFMEKDASLKRILIFIIWIFLITAIFAEAGVKENNAKLIQAAEKGDLKTVQTALNESADINATSIKKYYRFIRKSCDASDLGIGKRSHGSR